MALHLGDADPAEQLHDLGRAAYREGPHPVDHREEGLTPRRDPDAVGARERRFEVGGSTRADRGDLLGVVGVGVDIDDDRLREPVALFESLLEVGVDARRDRDGRAHDPEGGRPLEEPETLA